MQTLPPSAEPGNLRYMNEFVRLRCSVDWLRLDLFPNLKEVTESLAAFRAAMTFAPWDRKDPTVSVVAVGDGHTPRTAATFAFLTAWTCWSVDPLLRSKRAWDEVRRLSVIPRRIEEVDLDFGGPLVVAAVHSHADLCTALEALHAPEVLVVAIPCCFPQTLPVEPIAEYDDFGIWSARRTVRIWRLP
jgi:hypothetical protein